jgi:membrane-associated phospholipid phosphatase
VEVDLVVTERHRRLGLAAVALSCFAVLAVLVRQRAPALASLDASWHASMRLYGLAHPGWLTAMRAITHIGDTVTVIVVDLAAFVVCLVQRRTRVALFVAVAAVGTWSVRLALRELVARPRPEDAFWPAEGLSFPSGHTTNSAAMAVIVTVTVWPLLAPFPRRILVAVAVLVPLAVGLSRVAGGVHWPSDVLGGLLLALATTAVSAAVILPRD